MDELDLEESIEQLVMKAPKPVQEFILNSLSEFTIDLIAEYALHLDQGGVVQNELLLMLVGQENPTDFSKALIDSGIPAEDVRNIVNDVNEKVFKKLRDQELNASASAAPAPTAYRTEPSQPAVPVMQVVTPPPAPITLVSQPTPIREPHLINLIRPEVPQATPATQIPTFVPQPPAPAVAPIASIEPEMRTMASDMQALQHPEASRPVVFPSLNAVSDMSAISAMPSIPHPSQVSPARSFQTASVPYTSIPTLSQPTADSAAATGISSSGPKPLTDYSNDPYREPVE